MQMVNKSPRRRSVKRAQTASGAILPTVKELALVRELATRLKLALPDTYEHDLPFVRAFLSVFALDRATNPPELVLRRLRNARQLAWDGLAPDEVASKLELPVCLGPILHRYGLDQVPRRWHDGSEPEPTIDMLLDRLTEAVLDGDELVEAGFVRAFGRD
jgi:hypothetical protein